MTPKAQSIFHNMKIKDVFSLKATAKIMKRTATESSGKRKKMKSIYWINK